jgi:hypothetical protein
VAAGTPLRKVPRAALISRRVYGVMGASTARYFRRVSVPIGND